MLNHGTMIALLDFIENSNHAVHHTRMLCRARAKSRHLLDKSGCLKQEYADMLVAMRRMADAGASHQLVLMAAMAGTEQPRPAKLSLYERYK